MNYAMYQKPLVDKSFTKLLTLGSDILGAAPSAGKTEMAIDIIERYLQQYPDGKIFVLTHGHNILRNQFHERVKERKNFRFQEIKSEIDIEMENHDVFIVLPQTLKWRELDFFSQYKKILLVVDEAHQYYHATMVRQIIKELKPSHQLLLTGSPSRFIKTKQHSMTLLSLGELLSYGVVIDPIIELAQTSAYSYSIKDYNKLDSLRETVKISKGETEAALNDVLTCILKRLNSLNRTNPRLYNLLPEWAPALGEMGKTMFVCKDQNQARDVAAFFERKGVQVALSISDTDNTSAEIENFKDLKQNCKVLIVVHRGILGFNFPQLMNIIDMGGSLNPDVNFQLICRLVRKNPTGNNEKLFLKVCPPQLSHLTHNVMSIAVALSDARWYSTYDGNYRDIRIPILRPYSEIKSEPKIKGLRNSERVTIQDLPELYTFNSLRHLDDSILASTHWTTFRETRDVLKDYKYRYWNLERCKESALKYTTKKEWKTKEQSSYCAAQKHGWIDQCCGHMPYKTPRNYWTLERCKESALKYLTMKDWKKNERPAYNSVNNHKGWLPLCNAHMLHQRIPKTYWTLEKCKKSALNFSNKNQWRLGFGSAFNAAQRNGWMSLCCAHMKRNIPKNYWTLERCIESALKYNTRGEWRKKKGSAYKIAGENGWIEKCCAHMVSETFPHSYWTLERCRESALKYKTKSAWQSHEVGAYSAAIRNGWMYQCTNQMLRVREPNGYWTLERCKESALKYSSQKEWRKKRSGAYNSAQKNGWIAQCCSHMTPLRPGRKYKN